MEKSKFKKVIIISITIITLLLYMFVLCNCASCDREMKTCSSDINNGMDRIINVYNYQGEKIATFEGFLDVQANEGGEVLFDYQGKRYVYYNFQVEVIEK